MKRELVLSTDADATFTRFIEALRQATGSRLTASHAFRGLMRSLIPVVECIAARSNARMSLPSNAAGYESQRDEFERHLAGIISKAAARGKP